MSFSDAATDSGSRMLPGTTPTTETILLVEDEQMVRRLVRHILEVIGYNVLEAESGSEAMEICENHNGSIHLLLTDVVLPQMSGPDLSKRVVRIWPDIGILFMSGYTHDVMAKHGVEEDADTFLQKPFSPAALTLKVRQRLDACV